MNPESIQLLERVRTALEAEYDVERELGRGGMAAVYLARDRALERQVAIKVMLPNYGSDPSIQDRFVVEARTVAHLDHPNIVTVYSVKERDGLRCFVMKFVDGRSLDLVIGDPEPLDPRVAASLLSQVAEALHFAHVEGIVHRDVKPSNILLDARGRPVVTDFGIAKVQSGRSLTMTGSMLGTPAYMSPEQCRGQTAGPASDQYALGVLAFEVLARRLPFEGGFWELVHAHTGAEPPPLATFVPGLDPEIAGTVDRMLAKDPDRRWPSLGEVARRFAAAVPPSLPPSRIRAILAEVAMRGRPAPAAGAPRTHEGTGTRSPEPVGEADASAMARPDSNGTLANDAPTIAAGPPASSPAPAEPARSKPAPRTTPPPALVVTPQDPQLEVGDRLALGVTRPGGEGLEGIPVHWQSEDPSIVAVDDDGLLNALAEGFAKVTASAGGAVGRAQVTVRAAARNVVTLPGAQSPGSGRPEPAMAALREEGREDGERPRRRVDLAAAPSSRERSDPLDRETKAPARAAGRRPLPAGRAGLAVGVGIAVLVGAGGAWWVAGGEGEGAMGDDAGRFLVELPLAIDPGTSALAAGLEASAEAAARTAPEAAPPVASTPAPVSGRPAPTEPEVDGEPEAPDPEGPAVAVAEPESDPGPSPEEIFALTCGDPDAARTLLASGLASDPAGRLEALFRPAGGADQATLQETLEALQGVGPIRVEVRTAGNEPVANGCRWLMEVDFLWTNAFGQPRSRNVRLRMELEAPEGAPAIRALSGIS